MNDDGMRWVVSVEYGMELSLELLDTTLADAIEAMGQ